MERSGQQEIEMSKLKVITTKYYYDHFYIE
jgi:hypothetical protein